MEILRLPETTSIQAKFNVTLANTAYTMSYVDLITDTSYSASATSTSSKTVTFTLDNYYLTYSGNLDASVYQGANLVYSSGIDIIRPYCDITEVKERLNITTAQAIQYEQTARQIIESEAGAFNFIRKDKEVTGMGLDYLPINERIQTLYKMYENGVLIHDSSDPDLDLYKISIDKSSIIPSDSLEDKMEYKVVWEDRYLSANFAVNYDYLIDGDFGYKVVPGDIQKACELLMTDMVQGNNMYINRYIQMFDNNEFKVQFTNAFSSGTGNFTVDKILSKYKNRIIPGVI